MCNIAHVNTASPCRHFLFCRLDGYITASIDITRGRGSGQRCVKENRRHLKSARDG